MTARQLSKMPDADLVRFTMVYAELSGRDFHKPWLPARLLLIELADRLQRLTEKES